MILKVRPPRDILKASQILENFRKSCGKETTHQGKESIYPFINDH